MAPKVMQKHQVQKSLKALNQKSLHASVLSKPKNQTKQQRKGR